MKSKKQSKLFWGAASAILAIAVIALLMLRSCVPSGNDADVPFVLNPSISESVTDEGPEQRAEDEILADLNQKVSEGMITMSMNPDPIFDDGKASGNLLIHNENANHHAQVIMIARDDTQDVIYSSGLVPVGKYLNSDKLDVALSAGDYPCTAYFHSVDDVTGEVLGTGAVHITIHVKN